MGHDLKPPGVLIREVTTFLKPGASHRIALVRLRWHEYTKAYAERRKAEGLSSKDILRCLKRFIAREVFHLLMGKPPRRTAAS